MKQILASIVLAAGLLGLARAQDQSAAAIVNGEIVPRADVERIAAFITQQKFALVPATVAQKQAIQREVVAMLIDDMLMRQFLAKNGPPVAQAEVDKEFANFVAEQTRDGQRIEDFYRESGQTERDIRIDLHTMMQWVGYAKSQVKDDDLKRYYESNKDLFDQTTVRASHILKQVAADASPSVKQAAREKLLQLRGDIVAGKIDFAEAAKKESDCQVSAPVGGDVGYFPRKFVYADAFAQPAFSLKVGEVSDIIETPYGLHILKVTDRKVGRPSQFDQVIDEVREFYVEEMRLNVLQRAREQARIEFKLP